MEKRNKIKRVRITPIFTQTSGVKWIDVKKLNIPETDTIISIGVETYEEKAWDDEGGTMEVSRLTVRSWFYDDETDEEYVTRKKQELLIESETQARKKAVEDAEYLDYLRLKVKYEK